MCLPEPAPQPFGQNGRERLLVAARELFTRRGASNVGINDVTAAAGVARMTLYNNFPSKEALTHAVYEEMVAETLEELRGMDTETKSEEARIEDLFAHFDLNAQDSDYRGCPFIHASLQAADPSSSIHGLVTLYKRALRTHVLGLLDEGRNDRDELADLIVLLLDGVVTEAYLKGVDQPTRKALRGVSILLRRNTQATLPRSSARARRTPRSP